MKKKLYVMAAIAAVLGSDVGALDAKQCAAACSTALDRALGRVDAYTTLPEPTHTIIKNALCNEGSCLVTSCTKNADLFQNFEPTFTALIDHYKSLLPLSQAAFNTISEQKLRSAARTMTPPASPDALSLIGNTAAAFRNRGPQRAVSVPV